MDARTTQDEYYKDERIQIRVDLPLMEDMKREAERQGTTLSGLVRALFENLVRWRDGEGLNASS